MKELLRPAKALIILAAACILALPAARAQQDAQFSMYMFNRMVLNPGYAGARGATNITAVGRSQWVGIEGHPNTFTLSADAPISVLHGGIGGHLLVDQVGPIQTIGLRGAYAFRFDLGGGNSAGEGPALQIGIAPGLFQKQIDGTNFLPEDVGDPVLQGLIGTTNNQVVFDLGAGVYLNGANDKYFVGASVDHLTQPTLDQIGEGLSETNLPLTVGAMAGYTFGNVRRSNILVTPSAHFRMAGSQMQFEGNVNVDVDPMVFGISYRGLRNLSDLVAIIGFHANQRLFIAYSYDYTISGLQGSTSGSHEILLSYTFPRFTRFA